MIAELHSHVHTLFAAAPSLSWGELYGWLLHPLLHALTSKLCSKFLQKVHTSSIESSYHYSTINQDIFEIIPQGFPHDPQFGALCITLLHALTMSFVAIRRAC